MEYYTNFTLPALKTWKTKGKNKQTWSDNILTFDIEQSSFWVNEQGDTIEYHPFESENYWKSLKPYSLCYIWQFGFDDKVYYGREIQDFLKILDQLPQNINFIIYVHNLSYEFQTLINIMGCIKVFARESHKPMKFTSDYYPNIEFRCSYMLTRLSLESWGKELGLPKMVGDLDYTKVRTPKSKLTDTELKYCERDCEVVYEGIKKYREKYEHVKNIPLTQTGEVRNIVKPSVLNNKYLKKHLPLLTPRDFDEYSRLKKAFAGGYTHANFIHAGHTIKCTEGYAFDFTSSYPAVMCSEKFPMQPFKPCNFNLNEFDDYAFLVTLELTNVDSKLYNHYISISKCVENSKDDIKKYNIKIDNGRVISADKLTMTITEQDFLILQMNYTFDYKVIECYKSRKQYLPKEIVECILYYYNNKTKYKNVVGKEDIYTQSKQFVNSIYGMMVTDLVQDEILFEGAENWVKVLKNALDITSELQEKFTTVANKNIFTSYAWGVWITAYARKNLWDCLVTCDEDAIYCDTDSIKIKDYYNFTWYNNRIKERIDNCLNYHGLDVELSRPKDPSGTERQLGLFLQEDSWTEFKTLGAKRYCYRTKKDGELHLTVSGISKKAVLVLKNDIHNFNEETVFDKDYWEQFKKDVKDGKGAEYNKKYDGLSFDEICEKYKLSDGTKKMITYCVMDNVVVNKGQYDEYESHQIYGINMRNTSYSMSLADEFINLIFLEDTNHLQCIK